VRRSTGRAPLDLAGQVFGLLTVIRRYAVDQPTRARRWLCRCVCGGEQTACTGDLRRRKVRSCGCLMRAASRATLRTYNRRVRA
jgi:hypothetical protein